jgi:Ca2+-dependent lipid-binding protein
MYKVKTDMGYCGTDETHEELFENELDAQEFGDDYIMGMISVEVFEVFKCEKHDEYDCWDFVQCININGEDDLYRTD